MSDDERILNVVCLGKIGYATRGEAEVVKNKMRKRGSRRPASPSGVSLAAYQCPKCRLWHLGRGLVKKTLSRKEGYDDGE